jgi:anti-sigma B factor antagonist
VIAERKAKSSELLDMTDSLQISVERNKEAIVMILQGRVDIESSPQLRNRLLALLQEQSPPETVAIDLAAVGYVGTAGIATLIEALKVARIGGITMHLQGLQGRLLHLFQSTGIGSLFADRGLQSNSSTATVS